MDSEKGRGKPLLFVAKEWSNEIERDKKTIASILFRFIRGDYKYDPDQPFDVIFSHPDKPVRNTTTRIEEITLSSGAVKSMETSAYDYSNYKDEQLLDNITEYAPLIYPVQIAEFCNQFNIPFPAFIAVPKLPTEDAEPEQTRDERLFELAVVIRKAHPTYKKTTVSGYIHEHWEIQMPGFEKLSESRIERLLDFQKVKQTADN